ncbi:MAG TPA: hypothetical protein VGF49_13090 [Candidatus Solibacter sp.]|jgi:hypothetical protein
MAKKKTTEEAPEGILETAAKTLGTAAGKIAAAVGVTADKKPAKVKIPKLASKNKSRLPRKQKKALKKAEK